MATTAKVGYGVLFKRGDGGGTEVFTSIGELKGITGPSWSLDTLEASSTDSTSAFKEYVAGMADAGEVTLTVNFLNDATQSLAAGILLDLKNRTKRNFQIVFQTATTATYSITGFVTKFTPSAPINDVMTVAISIKLTGLPTVA